MEGCAIPSPIDMDEIIVKGYISRLLSDNYTLLIIFIIVTIVLIIVLIYFVKQVQSALKDYYNNIIASDIPTNIDNEVYNEEESKETNTSKFQDPNKLKFYKGMTKVYNSYNVEKSNYIKSTYNRDSDDNINDTVIYKKYDNYKYEKKD